MAQSAVLGSLRKRMKAIFWFTAIVFIALVIFGWGADITGRSGGGQLDSNIAGTVGDYEISYLAYRNAIQSEYEQAYREERPITEAEAEIISDRTWFTLVNRHIAEEHFKSKAIGELTPTEILESLRRDPPDAVKNLPAFQQNGAFSEQLFQEYLGNPQVDWLPVEMLVRNRLPYDKLRQLVNATAFVTNAEAIAEFEFRNTQAAVSFISMDPFSVENFSVDTSAASVEAYYNEHIEDYRRAESALINYIKLAVEPTPNDTNMAKTLAESLIVRIEAGEEFEFFAENYSDDPGSKANGGRLGWIQKGQMVAEFEEAAFSADSGELVGPVLTQFGYHIIRIEGKDTVGEVERADVSHILLMIDPSADTEDSIASLAKNFVAAIEGGASFLELAGNLKIDSMAVNVPVKNDDPIPGIGYLERARAMIFKSAPGSVEEFAVRYRERPVLEGITVVQLVKRFADGIPELNDIRAEVIADMEKSARERAALAVVTKAKSLVDFGTPFEAAAKEVGASFDTTGLFSMNSWVNGVGPDPIFKGRVFGIGREGAVSAPFLGDDGKAYIFKIEKIIPPNPQDFQNMAVSVKNEILWGYRQDIYDRWFSHQRDMAVVVDNRFAEEFAVEEVGK